MQLKFENVITVPIFKLCMCVRTGLQINYFKKIVIYYYYYYYYYY
jgi:hypothetical protein